MAFTYDGACGYLKSAKGPVKYREGWIKYTKDATYVAPVAKPAAVAVVVVPVPVAKPVPKPVVPVKVGWVTTQPVSIAPWWHGPDTAVASGECTGRATSMNLT
jgi:hypothetical protein